MIFSPTFRKRLIQLIITLLSTPWISWELVFLFYHGFAHTWWIDGNMLSCSISHQVNLRFLLAFRKLDIYRHYYLIFLLPNSIFSNVPSVRLLFFVDDAKLFSRVSSSTDCDVLQLSFNNFINWCQAVGLTLNFDKCKIISFSRSRILVDHVYTYNDALLTRVSEVKDLGIIYTSSLSFRPHIDYITCKALPENTRSTQSFHIPTSRSNFLSNDPLVRAMRSLNNNNFDIWP